MEIKSLVLDTNHLELCDISVECEAILEKINTRFPFFMYPQAEDIIRNEIVPRFRDAIKENISRGRILFLCGDYNTGKSFLLQYTTALIRLKFEDIWKSYIHPIKILDLRDDINSAQQFYIYLLDQFQFPIETKQLNNWRKTNCADIRLRDLLISTLERYQTRILILDECQRLLRARNSNIPNIFEALKDLTNKCYWHTSLRTHIILCGTEDGIPLLEAADWIQDRTQTIRLRELSTKEFGPFLWQIYHDYIHLGISKEWNLTKFDDQTKKEILNPEITLFLFQRSHGKVGLTVEIIRDAVKRALNQGRMYPILDDYKLVLVDGETLNPNKENLSKKCQIIIGYSDRVCQVEGCPKYKEAYSKYRSLIDHYKTQHPNIELRNKEGKRI